MVCPSQTVERSVRLKRMNRTGWLVAVLALVAVAAPRTRAEQLSIYETAKAAGGFTTLVAALEATGLDETLSAPGAYTVFAPTDKAFAKLPKGTVEALLKDPEKLKSILLYHVAAGEVFAADVLKLKNNTEVKTLQGSNIKVFNKGGVRVNNAKVTATDIDATNGVIHVIDTVLIPRKK